VVLYLSESIIYAGGVVPELADWSSAEDWHNFTQRQFAEWPSTTPAPARGASAPSDGQSSVAETIEGLYDGEEPKLAYCAFEASSHTSPPFLHIGSYMGSLWWPLQLQHECLLSVTTAFRF
jgi:hypothetical protein